MKNGDVITSLNILFGKKKFNLEIAIKKLTYFNGFWSETIGLVFGTTYPNYGQKIYVTEDWKTFWYQLVSLKRASRLESEEGPEKSL